MADDDNKPKEEVEESTPVETPPAEEPVEEPKEEPQEEETPPEEPPKEEPKETPQESPEEPEISPRQALAIQRILSRPTAQQSQQPAPPAQGLDYGQALEADPEVIKQLEADRTASGQQQFNAGLEQARTLTQNSEWRTLLSIDAPITEDKYGWLNPKDKEHFDPAMADAVNEEYKRISGYDEQTGLISNPGVRYSDFVDARVELSTRLAEAMTANTAKNVAKQAAATGLRPDGSSAKRLNLNKAPEDMTLEELYAKIGQPMPK